MSVTSNLPLKLGLVDTKSQLTSPLPDRASDAYVVNPDGVMVKYRGNGENLVEDSDDLTQASWTETGSGTVNSATLFTFAAQNDVLDTDITTEEGKSYIYSFSAQWISGNTSLKTYHNGSATGNTTALTVTGTLTRYSVTVLGKAGGGTVEFGIQDINAGSFGQLLYTDIQVEETSVAINELETQAGYTKHGISLVDGQSWFTADNLGSDLFNAGAGVFTPADVTIDNGAGYPTTTTSMTVDAIPFKLVVGSKLVFAGGGEYIITTEAAASATTIVASGGLTGSAVIDGEAAPSGTYSWTAYGTNTIENDSGALKISYVSNDDGAFLYLKENFSGHTDLSADLVSGDLYKITYDAKVNTGSVTPTIWSGVESAFSVPVTNTEFQSFNIYFIASDVDEPFFSFINTMGAGEIIWLDNITIQAVISPAEFADSGYLLQVTDGSGKKASGYINEVGTGETPVALPNDITDITKADPGVVSSIAHGLSVGNIVYFSGLTEMTELNGTYQTVTAVGGANEFSINDTSGYGAAETTDAATGFEVTEPNPNSVKIYKTNALAFQGWMIEDGFDPNDIASWVIRDNRLGDTEPRVYTATSGGTATIPAETAFNDMGLVNIGPVTNWLLQSKDWTQAIWTKSNMTTAYTSTGMDGTANSATRLTASLANGTAVQVLTIDGSTNSWFFWARRITGTGDVQLTDDNFTSNTVLALTSSWKKFEINDAGSAPTVGIKIVTNTDAIDVDFGMLIERPYSVNWAIPTLSVPVTTTSQVVPWTMSTVFKGILSDAVNGSESEGTLICSWTPYYDESDGSGDAAIISISDSIYSILYTLHDTGVTVTYDSTNVTNSTLSFVANTTYTLIIRWSKRQNKLQVSVISAGVLTNGTAGSYDDAFALGTDLIIGFGNNYPFSIKEIQVYSSYLSDFEVKSYPDSGSTVRRHILQGR